MDNHKSEFIRCMIDHEVLQFGEFTLKSGRSSPYFFNLGNISSGHALMTTGEAYATALLNRGIEVDVLFGPAYKGIPLVTAMALALAKAGHRMGACFDRKEAKTHGEGGLFIGAPMRNRRVLLVDDVVADGTQKRRSADLIREAGGSLVGVLVGLDRMDLHPSSDSTFLEHLAIELEVPVFGVITLEDVIEYMKRDPDLDTARQALMAQRPGSLREFEQQ